MTRPTMPSPGTHPFVARATHYARVAELLEANNLYLERARRSEAQVASLTRENAELRADAIVLASEARDGIHDQRIEIERLRGLLNGLEKECHRLSRIMRSRRVDEAGEPEEGLKQVLAMDFSPPPKPKRFAKLRDFLAGPAEATDF